MRHEQDILDRTDANAWREELFQTRGFGHRFVEIQITDKGIDFVLCKLDHDHLRLAPYRVDRWWTSEQSGYSNDLDAVVARARKTHQDDNILIVDLREDVPSQLAA